MKSVFDPLLNQIPFFRVKRKQPKLLLPCRIIFPEVLFFSAIVIVKKEQDNIVGERIIHDIKQEYLSGLKDYREMNAYCGRRKNVVNGI